MADEVTIETVRDESVKDVLIDLVRAQPVLWNMQCDEYLKTRMKGKDAKWAIIATELNITVPVAKSTWRNLITTYARELKKCKVSDTLYTGSWQHFSKLRFLSNTMKPRATSDNLDGVEFETRDAAIYVHSWLAQNKNSETLETPIHIPSSPTPNKVEVDDHVNSEFVDEFTLNEDTDDSFPTSFSSLGTGSSSSSRERMMQRLLDLEKEKLRVFLEIEKNRSVENDADLMFLKSLLPYMKLAKDKLSLRQEMMRVISNFLSIERSLRVEK